MCRNAPALREAGQRGDASIPGGPRLHTGVERGAKRHLALEVLWNTNPVASALRSGKIESLDNVLLTGRDAGMISIDESVRKLLLAGKITKETAEQNVRELAVLYR